MRRAAVVGLLALVGSAAGADQAVRTESFDRDPGWEGFRNRLAPDSAPLVVQDFGYSPTAFAGRAKGEVGGQVWRSNTPAYYAAVIGRKTLGDKLTASGTFAVIRSGGSSGAFFGWFDADQPGTGRPLSSLGLYLDGEATGCRFGVFVVSGSNRTVGAWVTPFIPGKFKPTPVRSDGTRYAWTLAYDPAANGGRGRVAVTIRGPGEKPEAWEGKEVAVDLPERLRLDGATFDRFGLMNLQRAGHGLTAYFADLTLDSKPIDLAADPKWDGRGNRVKYRDRERPGAHDFGFSKDTAYAGGKPGEVGGLFWRTEKGHGYYAAKVGPLSLDDRLEAGGRVVLRAGAPDSDMAFGWFDSARAKGSPPGQAGPFVGVTVGGPSRVGHCFLPAYMTAKGAHGGANPDKGPALRPGVAYTWSLVYDPKGGGGAGSLRLTLEPTGDPSGRAVADLTLGLGHRAEGGRLDRFGVFTGTPGGGPLKVYLDDLRFTAARGGK